MYKILPFTAPNIITFETVPHVRIAGGTSVASVTGSGREGTVRIRWTDGTR